MCKHIKLINFSNDILENAKRRPKRMIWCSLR